MVGAALLPCVCGVPNESGMTAWNVLALRWVWRFRNQEFMLPVPDPSAAQLECTIWDESDHQVLHRAVPFLEVLPGQA
jgi:hypothetical protein